FRRNADRLSGWAQHWSGRYCEYCSGPHSCWHHHRHRQCSLQPIRAEFGQQLGNRYRPVLQPLAITSQPQSQSVPAGGTAVFKVGVSGTPPFAYQWYFGATRLTAQINATLTLTNVTPAQAGSYKVIVFQLVGGPEGTAALASA